MEYAPQPQQNDSVDEEAVEDEIDEIAEEIREQEEYAVDEEDMASFEDNSEQEESVE